MNFWSNQHEWKEKLLLSCKMFHKMCHKRTMQSLCVSTFVTVVEVLRDNRKRLSLLMRNIDISNLCEERLLYFPLLNSFVPHLA